MEKYKAKTNLKEHNYVKELFHFINVSECISSVSIFVSMLSNWFTNYILSSLIYLICRCVAEVILYYILHQKCVGFWLVESSSHDQKIFELFLESTIWEYYFGLLFRSWKTMWIFFLNWINFFFSNLNLMKTKYFKSFKIKIDIFFVLNLFFPKNVFFFFFFFNNFLMQDIKQIYHAFYSRYWLNYGPRWLQKYHLLRSCAPQQIVLFGVTSCA